MMTTKQRLDPVRISKLWNTCNRSKLIPNARGAKFFQCKSVTTSCSALYSYSNRKTQLNSLIVPVPVKVPELNKENVGEEMTGVKLTKTEIKDMIKKFSEMKEIQEWSDDMGINDKLFKHAVFSFTKWCIESREVLEPELYITFCDIKQDARSINDLLPYFIQHAKKIFPHLDCMEDLKKISDLSLPANWDQFQLARKMVRKIYFHAGPTNSGKTYHAMASFLKAGSGIYCAPLKLLAAEIAEKSNSMGTPCDLVTGEEKKYANPKQEPSNHVSCTIEMASFSKNYDVAIIDEIQLLSDKQRGGAWTKALFGLPAKEIHLCGEYAAIELVKGFCEQVGEKLEIRKYKRLTPLIVEEKAVEKIENVKPGDCIVCFKKTDIFSVSRQLEEHGMECSVIYGSLPPSTKLNQAKKFNDPSDPCNILVATDAVGMGLNLCINRIVFYSLNRPNFNRETGEKEFVIATSQALQIAGRAGRFNTRFKEGFVTTFKGEDLPKLKEILSKPVEKIMFAGLLPTPDQIEQFSNLLPHATLLNLLDIFLYLCKVDTSQYFLCDMDSFRFVANLIKDIPLDLRTRYVFCNAPINKENEFVAKIVQMIANRFVKEAEITGDWLFEEIGWPLGPPKSIEELTHLELVFDSLDLYLWLGNRFSRKFPDMDKVREVQNTLDKIINEGVNNIINLIKLTSINAKHKLKFDVDGLPITRISQRDGKATPAPGLNLGKGTRLTEKLIKEGLLTSEQVKQLKTEWKHEIKTKKK